MEPVEYNIKKNRNSEVNEITNNNISETKRETIPNNIETRENKEKSAIKLFFIEKK